MDHEKKFTPSFSPAEIANVTAQVLQRADEYTPAKERIARTHFEMEKTRIGIINLPLEKFYIVTDIILQNPQILAENIPAIKEKSEAQFFFLAIKVSEHLTDDQVEKCYRRAGLTWWEMSQLRSTLISYLPESELADHLLNYGFKSGTDHKKGSGGPANTDK